MNPSPPPQLPDDGQPAVTGAVLAEAAVWVARLHGPSRCRQMELDCLAWQAKSAAHRQAFERCTDTWELAGGLSVSDVISAAAAAKQAPPPAPAWPRRAAAWGLAALACIGLLAGALLGVQHWRDRGVYHTEAGEQRSVVLDDGTRLSLNTSTRVRVDMPPGRPRNVAIAHGEALFEVASDPARPFVVHAGGSEVIALGTSFAVRYAGAGSPEAVAVTLIEGRVSVQPAPGSAVVFEPVAMAPGDRLRIGLPASAAQPAATTTLDRPPIEQALAWQRSEIVFDGTPLAEAVGEMNRYTKSPIVLIGGPDVAQRRVSGVYRTSDIHGFAHAVAALHGLALKQQAGGWALGPAV